MRCAACQHELEHSDNDTWYCPFCGRDWYHDSDGDLVCEWYDEDMEED